MVFTYKIRGGRCRNAHSSITLTSEDITCYVGRDKHENEYLIRYGWPGDVWFHVEGISSAHVYFRLDCFNSSGASSTSNTTHNPLVRNLLGKIPIDDLPTESIEDMCQIVKHNSIKGCKMASCRIVYTPHSNLKKEERMDSGTVTYHDTKLQRFQRCDKDRGRIKELEATKSADNTSIDYYEEMKANERRIIEHRRKLKKSGHNGSSADVGIYDPVLSDLKGMKAKAQQQGDRLSGMDAGLAFLEDLTLGSGGYGSSGAAHPTNGTRTTTNDNDDDDDDAVDDQSHLPIWQQEANHRLENHTSKADRFFLARGYTLEEIKAVTKPSSAAAATATATTEGTIPFSVTLSKLWNNDQKQRHESSIITTPPPTTTSTSDLLAQIYEARNEEKEVLEAIYGEDDHVQFGWRNDDNNEDDGSDEDSVDPSRPFSFDSVIIVPGYEPPPRYEYPPPLLLEIYVDHGVSNYPFGRTTSDDDVDPPVLAVVGGGLPEAGLRKLTRQLRKAALEKIRSHEVEAGEPQIFDLLQATSELAASVVEAETAWFVEETKQKRARAVREERQRAKEEAERLGIAGSSTTKLTFKSEADRQAYAKSILKRF